MPSSFLRMLSLGALLYFIFYVPIGRERTLADHAREIWATTQMRQALENQSRQIKHDIVERMRQWHDSQQPRGTPQEFDPQSEPAPEPASPRHRLHPQKSRPKNSRGRPGESLPPPASGDLT